MGTVGVRPSDGGAGSIPGKAGTGMLGTVDGGGIGAGRAWARLPMEGGGGGSALATVGAGGATAPNDGACGMGGADAGNGGGAAGIAVTGGGGGGPPVKMGGGGGGGAPPNPGAGWEFPPAPEGIGKLLCWGAAAVADCGAANAPSFGSGGGGKPSSVFCRIGGGAALLTGGAGGKLGGGGGGGAAPKAEGVGPSPVEDDFFERRSSKTSRSDPPLSLMMRSFS